MYRYLSNGPIGWTDTSKTKSTPFTVDRLSYSARTQWLPNCTLRWRICFRLCMYATTKNGNKYFMLQSVRVVNGRANNVPPQFLFAFLFWTPLALLSWIKYIWIEGYGAMSLFYFIWDRFFGPFCFIGDDLFCRVAYVCVMCVRLYLVRDVRVCAWIFRFYLLSVHIQKQLKFIVRTIIVPIAGVSHCFRSSSFVTQCVMAHTHAKNV